MMVVVMVVKKQLCTCRLKAGVVPGRARGQRLPLLYSVCTCNCSCGVLCLCYGCFSCHYGSIQPSTTAQHPLQPFIDSNPSSTTTAAQLNIITHHENIHFPATILLPAGRWLPVWRKLSLSSFGRGAGWPMGVLSSDWKWGEVTGGMVRAP